MARPSTLPECELGWTCPISSSGPLSLLLPAPTLFVWLAHSIIHVSAEILSLMGPFSVYMNMGPYVGEVALPPSSLIILLSTELT